MILADGTARFSCRRQKSSRTESWGVALPNLVTKWPSLNCDNILQPTWNVSSFLRPSTVNPTAASSISASHVSARNLKAPLFLHVGFVPGGAVDEVLVEGLEEGWRTWGLEVA